MLKGKTGLRRNEKVCKNMLTLGAPMGHLNEEDKEKVTDRWYVLSLILYYVSQILPAFNYSYNL